jgi:hypothetical protein
MMIIELNGRVLEPRELTMREIEKVLKALQAPEIHPLECEVQDEPISALAVSISTETPLDELLDLTPTQGKELMAQVRAKNPSLAREIERIGSLAERFLSGDQGEAMASALIPPSMESGGQSAG